MKEEFIPYNLAVALKELGFDEPCLGRWWSENELEVSFTHKYDAPKQVEVAPLYQQAFRWFRDKYGLTCWIDKRKDFANPHNWYIISDESDDTNLLDYDFSYETHQEAELECLKKLIEIVKTK
jgi:hypothetical protein